MAYQNNQQSTGVVSGKEVFIRLASDPEIIKKALIKSRQHFPEPHQAATHLVWYIMWLSGLDTQLVPFPVRFAESLSRFGFRLMPPVVKPQAGDLYVVYSPDKPEEEYIGIVAQHSADAADFFLATDYTMDPDAERLRPYRRFIAGNDQQKAVSAWVRYGAGGGG